MWISSLIKSKKKRTNNPLQNVNEHIVQYNSSFEDLIIGLTASGKYDHMRLILSKNNNRRLGQTYLMVSRSGFGIVKLIDINYGENRISMALKDISTGVIKNVHLDIDNPVFSFLLISWQDIQEISNSGKSSSSVGDELLDFEF